MVRHQAILARRSSGAIIVPALAAGTMYIASLVLASQALWPAESWPIELIPPQLAAGFLALLAIASIVGAVIAWLPIWLGVEAMSRLGNHNAGLRHPALWAIAGAAGAAGLAAPFAGWDTPQAPALALVFTGAGCAVLARRYVRWSDSEE